MLNIVEKYQGREYSYDIESRMFRDRIISLNGAIDTNKGYYITTALQYLEAVNPDEDISLIINSPGGEVVSGLAIIDVMENISCDVQTVCLGMAASMASLILAAGTKGKRFIYPHSEVMIHQPLGGAGGQASDIIIHTDHLIKTKDEVNKLLASYTGQSLDKIVADTDRDHYLTAQEAIKYGIVDKMYDSKKENE